MPTFSSDTVHGLSADVYFRGSAVRVFGEVTVTISQETLVLTANDEGGVGPVKNLRRGDVTTVTIPVADATGLATLSGIMLPFASGITAGPSSGAIILPKAQPGDDFLDEIGTLVLVARDGSTTWTFSGAVVTEIGELVMSEEEQMVWPATFTCYRFTHSGEETPFIVVSGSFPPA